MKLLVTGGAGFIGSHTAAHALRNGHDVAIIDDLSTGHRENVPEPAELHEVDMRRRDDVRQVFQEFGPDAVVHQAAQASVAISVRKPVLDASFSESPTNSTRREVA